MWFEFFVVGALAGIVVTVVSIWISIAVDDAREEAAIRRRVEVGMIAAAVAEEAKRREEAAKSGT